VVAVMGGELRRARQQCGWSQARLIYALQREARLAGIRIASAASLKTQLSRWENGHCVPDAVYRTLLCQVYGASPVDLGLTAARPVTEADSGLVFADTWSEGVVIVTGLWERDVSRRSLLAGSAFTAAAYGVPAFRWLVSDTDEAPASTTGHSRVGMPDVSAIRQMTSAFRAIDNQHGGGTVRDQAVRYLDREVSPLLRDRAYDSRTGVELFRATAELTQLVGWMTYDEAMYGLSQRYFVQALRLAKAAGDRVLGAEVLAAMSHQAGYLDEASSAIDLARAAASTARGAGVPALVAEAAVLEAQGHAKRHDEGACASALHRAETALDRADRSHDPHWISYFDEAYLSAKFGHCFRALGRGQDAERFAGRSLNMAPGYVRGRAFNLCLLATAHAQQAHVEQACAIGHQAAQLTTALESRRAVKYLTDLRAELVPYADRPEVRELASEIDRLAAA
jgi:transcriptional regulator with XRE-family HTH domain